MRPETITDASEMVITIKPESLQAGLNEFFAIDKKGQLKHWLDEGIGIVRLSQGFNSAAKHFSIKKPIFIQHICPIHLTICITGGTKDLNTILYHIRELLHLLDVNKSFSVQTRFTGFKSKSYKKFEVNELISKTVADMGLELNVTKPQQVISIVLSNEYGYIGISLTEHNLSDWAGGKYRLAKEQGQISRAEFKLIEAINVFDVPILNGGVALDLGAAPGGWTRVLLKHHFKVCAVDPADLDSSVKNHPHVSHFKETAQDFLKRNGNKKFDLIVNDMKMDVAESVSLMGDVENQLKTNGVAIMTLKLKKKHIQKTVKQAIVRLQRQYQITGVRQLFHNRSEVTVVMKRK